MDRQKQSSGSDERRGRVLELVSEAVVVLSPSLGGCGMRAEEGLGGFEPSLEVARGAFPPSGTSFWMLRHPGLGDTLSMEVEKSRSWLVQGPD